MRNPHVTLKVPELVGGSVIQKGSRIMQYSGGYTSVFPFEDSNGKKLAVRIWIADIGNAKQRSVRISEFLTNLNSSYFTGFKYLDDAILVNGTLHPIVLMEWVEGATLKEYINLNIQNPTKILAIAEKFRVMIEFFHSEGIAHGDLQHGNILIKKNGEIAVIDYDSMYISTLAGMNDTIKGLPGYQHPGRVSNTHVNPNLDFFSELIIYLSLLVFANNPNLWPQYYGTEDLLFSKDDLAQPNSSSLIKHLTSSGDKQIRELTQKLLEELQKEDITNLRSLEELLVDRSLIMKNSIIEKWENQPNPPTKRQVILPSSEKVTNRF